MSDTNRSPNADSRPDAELTGLVARGSRRLVIAAFLERLVITFTIAIGAVTALVIISRLTPWVAPVGAILVGAIIGAVAVAAVWAVIAMPKGVRLADEVDRRTGLRESLSTSYAVAGKTDGWSQAVIQNARDRARRVVLHDAIPLIGPNTSGRAPLIAAAALVLSLVLMPRHDLTGILAAEQQAKADAQEAQQVKLEIKAQEKKLEEILSEAGIDPLDALDEDQPDESNPEGTPEKPDEIRRNAIRKLTRLTDQLENTTKGEQAKSLEAMRGSLRKLKAAPPGPLQEFQRQLSRGNFANAQAQLDKLTEQLENNDLSSEQKEQLADQLFQLSEQLAEMAENTEQLEQQLKAAGMSAEQAQQAARDPNALDRMLEQMPSIPSPMQNALRQAAQAQQQASESMQAMASGAQQMAQSAQQQGQNGQNGQGSQQGAGQMSQALGSAASMAAEQAAANQALAEARSQLNQLGQSMCEGGACMNPGQGGKPGPGQTGQWAAGDSNRQGSGSGGPGQGNGSSPDAIATDFMLKDEKANVQNQGGPIIASTVVYGEQVRGESRAAFSTAVESAAADSAEAIETMRVPREYHDAVRAYFGRLERAAREKAASEGESGADAPSGTSSGGE